MSYTGMAFRAGAQKRKNDDKYSIKLHYISAFHVRELHFFLIVRNLHLELYSDCFLNYDLAQTQLSFSLSLFLSFPPAAVN